MKPKTKSQYWSKYFKKYYPNVSSVIYDYKKRTTKVFILYGLVGEVTCQKNDKWDFEKGFHYAYCKCLNNLIKKVKRDLSFVI